MTAPSNTQNVIKFFLLLRPYWKNIFVFIICGLVLTLLSLLYPWMTQWLIDEVMLRQDPALLLPILIITLIATGLRAALSFLNSYYVSYVQHKMAYDIQFRFFSHLQRLSFSFYDKRKVAEVLSRLQDAALSREIMINVLTTLINNLLSYHRTGHCIHDELETRADCRFYPPMDGLFLLCPLPDRQAICTTDRGKGG